MASNKKWFKRALRTLVYGEKQLWGLVKEKLTPEQVAYFEKEFLLAESKDLEVDPIPEATTTTTTPEKKKTASTKKTTPKTKRRTTTTPKKSKTTRSTIKEK